MKKLYYLFALVAFWSCETSFDPDLPEDGSDLAVYSFFRPDAPIQIDVFQTNHILDLERLIRIENLSVELLENQELIETISPDSRGIYQSQVTPEPLSSYEIRINSAGEDLTSTSYVPEAVGISDGTFNSELREINIGEFGYPAEIVVNDPPGINNYYALEFLIEDCTSGCDAGTLTGRINELLLEDFKVDISGSSEVNISQDPTFVKGAPFLYFDDKTFDGGTFTLDFFVIPSGTNFDNNPNVLIKMVLKSLTQPYYDYLVTADFQIKQEEQENFSEPVQVTSNINNGVGVFAGYNYSIFTLRP